MSVETTSLSPKTKPSQRGDGRRSYLHLVWLQFCKDRIAVIGAIVLAILFSLAIAAPLVATHDPHAIDLSIDANHLFGTDDSGRDWFSRALYGARVSLSVALMAVCISITIGTLVGSMSGFFGGIVDTLLMRFVEVLLSLPLFLIILIVQTMLPPSMYSLMLVIGLTSWMNVSRIVRGEVMNLRKQEYIEAARVTGLSNWRIVTRHILPNTVSSIIVAATLSIAYAILTEAALSYLGLGVPLPEASWGNMLQKGISRLQLAPWLVIFPGLLISITVLSFNAVGDGLRDAFDPRVRK
jgi:peptide/nickel transport system permease protein